MFLRVVLCLYVLLSFVGRKLFSVVLFFLRWTIARGRVVVHAHAAIFTFTYYSSLTVQTGQAPHTLSLRINSRNAHSAAHGWHTDPRVM